LNGAGERFDLFAGVRLEIETIRRVFFLACEVREKLHLTRNPLWTFSFHPNFPVVVSSPYSAF
jgi:hypothetical protein